MIDVQSFVFLCVFAININNIIVLSLSISLHSYNVRLWPRCGVVSLSVVVCMCFGCYFFFARLCCHTKVERAPFIILSYVDCWRYGLSISFSFFSCFRKKPRRRFRRFFLLSLYPIHAFRCTNECNCRRSSFNIFEMLIVVLYLFFFSLCADLCPSIQLFVCFVFHSFKTERNFGMDFGQRSTCPTLFVFFLFLCRYCCCLMFYLDFLLLIHTWQIEFEKSWHAFLIIVFVCKSL